MVANFNRQLVACLDSINEWTSYWLAQLAAVTTLLLTAVVTYSVILRYAFNAAPSWSDELASYCLLWMGFLGLAYTLNTGAHIRINVFIDRMSPVLRRYVEISIWIIGVVFGALLFLGCLSEVRNFIHRGTHSTEGLNIPLFWPAIPMVLGSGLFTLAMVAQVLRLVLIGDRGVLQQHDAHTL